MDETHTRLFKEIVSDKEVTADYVIDHYFNGYKKIRIKYDNNKNPIKLWFNDFLDKDFEIIVSPNKQVTKRYLVKRTIENNKFKSWHISQIDLMQANLTNKDLILHLLQEIKLINSEDFKITVFSILKEFMSQTNPQ